MSDEGHKTMEIASAQSATLMSLYFLWAIFATL